jgi:hypothetical protein
VCSNKQYLLHGACYASCPDSYIATGTGNFHRTCLLKPQCTVNVNDCFKCNTDRSACTMCAHSKFLQNGTCVTSCETGLLSTGTGRFNRVCKAPAACTQFKDSCYVCNARRSACLMCSGGTVLFNGKCVPSYLCPTSTHLIVGSGNFRKLCVFKNYSLPDPTCSLSNCRACASSPSSCDDCVPSHVLENGVCVARCSSNYVKVKGFGVSPLCVTYLSTGGCFSNGCLACSAGLCVSCSSPLSLFQGSCLAHCPTGTVSVGGKCL